MLGVLNSRAHINNFVVINWKILNTLCTRRTNPRKIVCLADETARERLSTARTSWGSVQRETCVL